MSTPEDNFVIEARPSPAKTGDDAWPNRDVDQIAPSDHDETIVNRAGDALQRHLKDFGDDDQLNVRRPDGSYVFPEWVPVSDYRRRPEGASS